MRALSLPGCACRGAFQFAVAARLVAAGERFDFVAGASSGSLCAAAMVAGLAARGPDFARALAGRPIVSTQYLKTERSPFGMRGILRATLRENLPEERLHDTEAELLIATTHWAAYARRMLPERLAAVAARSTRLRGRLGERRPALVVHSNRERRDVHDIILASCYLPILHAGVARLDGALHVDGALCDNTLLDALVARGATDITVVTPFSGGRVAQTMFAENRLPRPRAGVRLRVISPERPLSLGRFDLSPERVEEALQMPHVEHVVEGSV